MYNNQKDSLNDTESFLNVNSWHKPMEGIVVNYRRGRHVQKNKHMLIRVASIDTREKAEKLINKKVIWKSPKGKELVGEIKSTHGNNGVVRAIFDKGLPGQSIGTKIKVE